MLYYARFGDGRTLIIGAEHEQEAREICAEHAGPLVEWELASLGADFRGVIVFTPPEFTADT